MLHIIVLYIDAHCTYSVLLFNKAEISVVNFPDKIIIVILIYFMLLQVFDKASLTLGQFSEENLPSSTVLKEIASNSEQMSFFGMLSKSHEFIKWLKDETSSKNINWLPEFMFD